MAAGMCAHVWVDKEAEKGPQLELRLTVTHEIHVQKSTFSSKVLSPEKFYNLSKYFSLVGNTGQTMIPNGDSVLCDKMVHTTIHTFKNHRVSFVNKQ